MLLNSLYNNKDNKMNKHIIQYNVFGRAKVGPNDYSCQAVITLEVFGENREEARKNGKNSAKSMALELLIDDVRKKHDVGNNSIEITRINVSDT